MYHAIDKTDFMLLNNMEVMKGTIPSASYINALTGTSGTVSMYQVANQHQDKESVFESVREAEFPEAPSRLGAIYCFVSEDDANKANADWWDNTREIVAVETREIIAMGVYDSKQLDAHQADWEEAARRYFSGEHTAEPVLEAVICGRIHIYDWEKYKGLSSELLNI
ncbi:hypothetical protein QMT37_004294 [Vibrio fluvialis]|nr:hypothetical protein [Vibrio fluvialis]